MLDVLLLISKTLTTDITDSGNSIKLLPSNQLVAPLSEPPCVEEVKVEFVF